MLQHPIFEIKYELFEDNIEELQTIDRLTFDKEWHQIYGVFTLVVGGHEFIPYPAENLPPSAKRIYSELLLTHFNLLIDVYNTLSTDDYVAIKYVENSWSWLEIQADDEVLTLSELNHEVTSLDNLFQTDKLLLKNASFGSFSKIRINKKDFLNEIKLKTNHFIREIQGINSSLLDSNYFSKLLSINNHQ